LSLVHTHLLKPIRPVLWTMLPQQMLMRCAHWYTKRRYLRYLNDKVSNDWLVPDVDDGPAMSRRLRLLTRSMDEKSYQADYPDAQFFMRHIARLITSSRSWSRSDSI